MGPGSWYMFNKDLRNESVSSDHFSEEFGKLVELLREDPWQPGDALPGSHLLQLELTAG